MVTDRGLHEPWRLLAAGGQKFCKGVEAQGTGVEAWCVARQQQYHLRAYHLACFPALPFKPTCVRNLLACYLPCPQNCKSAARLSRAPASSPVCLHCPPDPVRQRACLPACSPASPQLCTCQLACLLACVPALPSRARLTVCLFARLFACITSAVHLFASPACLFAACPSRPAQQCACFARLSACGSLPRPAAPYLPRYRQPASPMSRPDYPMILTDSNSPGGGAVHQAGSKGPGCRPSWTGRSQPCV